MGGRKIHFKGNTNQQSEPHVRLCKLFNAPTRQYQNRMTILTHASEPTNWTQVETSVIIATKCNVEGKATHKYKPQGQDIYLTCFT